MRKKLPKEVIKKISAGQVELTCDKLQTKQSFDESDGAGRQAFIKNCAEG